MGGILSSLQTRRRPQGDRQAARQEQTNRARAAQPTARPQLVPGNRQPREPPMP